MELSVESIFTSPWCQTPGRARFFGASYHYSSSSSALSSSGGGGGLT